MRPKITPTAAGVTGLPVAETKNVRRETKCVAECPITGVEDLDDLVGQGQSAAAIAFGPDDVDVPVVEVDLIGLQGADLAGAEPAGVHQREERGRLPPPRGGVFECCRGLEEQVDLMPAQQVGVGGNERGFPASERT